ncbi:hypothetical protein CY34DRAFT_806838 [Suillus luteus UH-Slu-Lm8-n1]|uniref:Chromo domain-containing protein n=1 Tax=Suillus luteus UH-Slu-Lm8-n1 TaxID=930992 RepID=A0A0D0BB83_9AGAM|nr:hypothetical protein CY34DRAFT_806838 [Suillus luteus UH-Slu-Lm8-n1]
MVQESLAEGMTEYFCKWTGLNYEQEGMTEYFCKWTGLNYEHCTWETQEEVRSIAKAQIEAYRQREVEAKPCHCSAFYHHRLAITFCCVGT